MVLRNFSHYLMEESERERGRERTTSHYPSLVFLPSMVTWSSSLDTAEPKHKHIVFLTWTASRRGEHHDTRHGTLEEDDSLIMGLSRESRIITLLVIDTVFFMIVSLCSLYKILTGAVSC
jgi:hypothetical protein